MPSGMDQPRVALCASCDRCRARKTKCDGKRPCGNCANKYMKKHRLSSIEGIDLSLFECVYSPAKRRGPVPGKASQSRKSDEMESRSGGGVGSSSSVKGKSSNLMRMDMGMGSFGNVGAPGGVFNQQQAQLAALMGNGATGGLETSMGGMNQNLSVGMSDPLGLQQQLMLQQQQLRMQQGMGMDSSAIMSSGGFDNMGNMGQQNLMLQQQLLMQQMQQMQQQQASMGPGAASVSGSGAGTAVGTEDASTSQHTSQRARTEGPPSNIGVDTSVTKNLALLEKSSVDGNRLRSHYTLSIDTLFKLPPVPSDEEYCAKLNANMTPSMLPPFDVAALRAARFSEIALGALVSNQIALALELSSATVVCLKQCVEDPVHPSCMYDVAKAYFLHGMFRSYRGDMKRYFTYRRVCLAKLSQLHSDVQGIQQILAAISFHDSWAYMLYNASETDLPDINEVIPQVTASGKAEFSTNVEKKYQVSTDHSNIASDPKNQMWVQGPPPVFINNNAPPLSRSLDALACAIRSCCDMANVRFDKMSKENGGSVDASPPTSSATSLAVTSNEKELCSRNMVLSAFTLIQQSEKSNGNEKNHGHHLVVNAMDAFLEAGDEEEIGGFTDSQIQSLFSVCNNITSFPYLLCQGGPTYHMVCNAAILVCHLLNGLYSKEVETGLGEMESVLFDEALDSYSAVRKLLNSHRRKLPVSLRCHGLPGINLLKISRHDNGKKSTQLIDIGETQMCTARGCQGFVLTSCSPCVAAERAEAAQLYHQDEIAMADGDLNATDDLGAEFDPSLSDLAKGLDVDDDALLSILGKIVTA